MNSQIKRKHKKRQLSLIILLFILFFPFNSYSFSISSDSSNHKCIRKFLVFDVGSSTTKGMLYVKNVCDEKKTTIHRETFNHNYPYQACLSDSGNNIMPRNCIQGGIQAVNSIKEHFQLKCDKDAQCFAIATGWARYIKNPNDWSNEMMRVNVKPIIASQEYEGELKLRVIQDTIANKDQPFIAFDIGGGSFQLGWLDGDNQMHQYNSLYGTDNFTHDLHDKFLSEENKRCVRARNSVTLLQNGTPDPEALKAAIQNEKAFCTPESIMTLSENVIHEAMDFTYEKIGRAIAENKALQHFVHAHEPVIYADSLLFSLGIRKQLGYDKDIITIDEIQTIMMSLNDKTYNQVKELYPNLPDICMNTTQASMLILYTMLKNAGVNEIHIVQTDYMEQFLNSRISTK